MIKSKKLGGTNENIHNNGPVILVTLLAYSKQKLSYLQWNSKLSHPRGGSWPNHFNF